MTTKGQGEGGRLREGPAPELVAASFALEIADAPILHRGLGLADLAHVLVLGESGILPPEVLARLLTRLVELHALPVEDFVLDPKLEDVYSNREAWIRARDPEVAGWMGAGRPRREPATIAYRIAVRDRLLELHAALGAFAVALVERATEHIGTVVPDYTYFQPATPTSLAHYLLAFAEPVLRDLERVRQAYRRNDACPGGIGNVNGTRLGLDRARLAGLLGFSKPVRHTRDAMWQADQPIETMALLQAALVNADRLAEDLQIWSTREFALCELADRHARISLIMPQKKNPYALAFIRGITGNMLGRVVSMAAVGMTPSAQMDNRIFAIGEVPRALDGGTRALRLMAEVVRGLHFDVKRMAEAAGRGFVQATDLAELIVQEKGVPYRQAHRIVALAVRQALDANPEAQTVTQQGLEEAAKEVLGVALKLDPEIFASVEDPAGIVATRTQLGAAARGPVECMLGEIQAAVDAAAKWADGERRRLDAAEQALVKEAERVSASAATSGECP